MNDDNIVKVEVSELTTPKGDLLQVLEFIATLPMMVPKAVVELVARLAFTHAYTQVTKDLMDINKEMLDDIDNTMIEMMTYSEATRVKVIDDISDILGAS